jgi:predicted nucleotidyltransferase
MASPEARLTGTDRFGLPPYVMGRLLAIIRKYPAVKKVTLYGSRAKGNYRHNSDIDLVLDAPQLSWSEFNVIEQEIDDLLLPWKVDLALEHHIENPDLLDHIARVGITIN